MPQILLLPVSENKYAQSNLGRGPRHCESVPWGSLIMTAKVVIGRRRVYYAAPASPTLWAKPAHIAKARRSPVLKTDVAAT